MPRTDDAGPFLHIASNELSAEHVRDGLRRLGRDERVEHFWDDLSLGPLRDVDRGGASRVAWWSRVGGKKLPVAFARHLDDRAIWARIVRDARNVVLWYGPHVTEHLCALRACWALRRAPSRLFEVRLPPPHPDRGLDAFYGAVGIVGPDGVAHGWPTLRRVRNVATRAERWATLRSGSANTMRRLHGWRIKEYPLSYADADLVVQCAADWTDSIHVVAHVMRSRGPIGDGILAWRIRLLLEAGVLEGRGPERSGLDLPKEIRVTPGRRAAPPVRRDPDNAR